MTIPSFIEVQFPANISEGSVGGPGFKTDVFTAQSGFEQRNVLWQDSRAQYDVSHGIRSKADMDVVLAFFYNVRGKATGFRFKDWADYQLAAQVITAGLITSTTYQILKTYTTVGGGYTFTRNIRKPITATLSGVTVGGVPKTEGVDFTVDYTTGIMTFSISPGASAVVVGACEFDVPVRFDTDEMPITLEAFQLETWNSIKLVEIRV